MTFYDAHNHLQDERLRGQPEIFSSALKGLAGGRMVVNGTCERDWPWVAELARTNREIIPSFGCHPWFVNQRTSGWQSALTAILEKSGGGVGEIGLDHRIEPRDDAAQEEVFIWQLGLAAARNLPATIHCVQAWGRLLEILRAGPLPACGFLLHSYNGSVEMAAELAKLGAYFSMSGAFAHTQNARRLDTFRHIPPDRLLLETDAPSQSLPPERVEFPLSDAEEKPLNHPANLAAIYRFASEAWEISVPKLADQIEQNFHRLFGAIDRPAQQS